MYSHNKYLHNAFTTWNWTLTTFYWNREILLEVASECHLEAPAMALEVRYWLVNVVSELMEYCLAAVFALWGTLCCTCFWSNLPPRLGVLMLLVEDSLQKIEELIAIDVRPSARLSTRCPGICRKGSDNEDPCLLLGVMPWICFVKGGSKILAMTVALDVCGRDDVVQSWRAAFCVWIDGSCHLLLPKSRCDLLTCPRNGGLFEQTDGFNFPRAIVGDNAVCLSLSRKIAWLCAAFSRYVNLKCSLPSRRANRLRRSSWEILTDPSAPTLQIISLTFCQSCGSKIPWGCPEYGTRVVCSRSQRCLVGLAIPQTRTL